MSKKFHLLKKSLTKLKKLKISTKKQIPWEGILMCLVAETTIFKIGYF